MKDFNELVSTQSLFLHFLGSEPSSKVWRNLEFVKKSECSIFFFSLSFFSGMTTRFIKQKLAEVQEKKAKGGLISGLYSKKRSKVRDVSKDDPVVTPLSAHSLAKR